MFWPRVYIEAHNKNRHKLKGLAKDKHEVQGGLFGYVALKKECLYHFIKHAHASVVLNKKQGKF